VVITIIYLGELTQERYRGGAIASLTVAACFGIALAYLLGVFFPWRVSAGMVALLNFVNMICLTTLPESPLWLATNNKLKQGLEALEKIGASSDAEELPNALTESKVIDEPSRIQTGISFATIISTVIPPLLLFLFPISGVYSVSFFAIHLAESMHIGHPAAVAIAVGLMRTLGAAIGTGFVQRFGRRKSMIISAGLTTLFLISLFFLLLAKSLKFPIPEAIFNWATVILLLVTMFVSSLGMAPVPWILAGEWPAFKHKVSLV
jgi:predicted MFS family arabinose efflux permease